MGDVKGEISAVNGHQDSAVGRASSGVAISAGGVNACAEVTMPVATVEEVEEESTHSRSQTPPPALLDMGPPNSPERPTDAEILEQENKIRCRWPG